MPLDVSPFELLNTAAFLLCVTFCAYVISILVLYLRVPRLSGGDHRDYDWHIVVPCLNEAAVIDGTIRRLLRDFPRATIWCVDDNSDDGTAELVAEVVTGLGTDPRLRLIRRVAPDARQGKGAALNAAWRAIDRDLPAYADRSRVIVGVLDADSQLHARCLSALTGARYFGTDDVAAVQIEVRMLQCAPSWDNQRSLGRRARLLVRLQDMEFRGPIAAMQELRRRTGSVGMGGNGQFTRMSMLDRIAVRHGTPWHGALLEDFELGLHVLLNGGRTEYCPETWVAQEALTGIRPLIRQRTRWAQGSMQCVRYAPAVLRSRRIKNAGALEIVYFLAAPWTQLFGTIVYLGCLSVLGYYVAQAANGVQGWWSGGGWGVVPLVLVFGIAPFTVWGLAYRSRCEPGLRLTTALGLGLAHWLYSYVQSVAVWLAFVRLITFRTEWQKTARSDDPVRVLTRHRQPRRRSNRPRTRTATSRKQSADAQNSFQIHPLHSGSGRGDRPGPAGGHTGDGGHVPVVRGRVADQPRRGRHRQLRQRQREQ
ncbi:glycosyltransferase [Micromonospora sp. NBC_01699]|uniref:glycosyltransferase family 2 protein n=1 Tax=Micromonospora sp. NBC_01699 TaxID=2975984 RepID=UPI002E3579DA|nr:glycosyltransferase [Micromonospora sp. NBC_01699]